MNETGVFFFLSEHKKREDVMLLSNYARREKRGRLMAKMSIYLSPLYSCLAEMLFVVS